MSAIVREIVTVLGFKTNLKGIKDGEKALLSFKTKFALAASAASLAFSKTLDFFSGISEGVLESKDIADATGVALQNLLGMGKAAGKFGVRSKEINAIVLKANELRRNAIIGEGELYKIADETGIQFKDNNGQLLNTETILQNILKYLSEITDVEERNRIASLLFSTELAARVADIANNLKEFIAESQRLSQGVNKNIAENTEVFKQQKVAITQLENSWDSLLQSIVIGLGPATAALIDLLTLLTTLTGYVVNPVVKGVKEWSRLNGMNALREFENDSTYNDLEAFGKKVEAGTWTWADWWAVGSGDEPYQFPHARATPMTANVTNNIEVQLPVGTDIGDAQSMGNKVAEMVSQEIERSLQDIYNNNPQVE